MVGGSLLRITESWEGWKEGRYRREELTPFPFPLLLLLGALFVG
jgi:hypothetical protein